MNHAEFSSRGGKARAKSLTAKQRKRISKNAVQARWKKHRKARRNGKACESAAENSKT